MTKLIRKHQKVFAKDANSNELSIFGSLKAGIPAYSNDPDNIQSAEYLRGLFGAVIGDNSPAIEDHNSLFYLFSRQLAYLFQQGIAEWDSATEYHTGSLCSLSTEVGKIYVSRTDTNVNHSPTGTNWQLYWYVFDLNKLEKYTPFCVNNGNTDADGNGDLISFTGNILSFKIGGSYVNMGATTANGTHFDISSISDIDFASASNGTYYFYIQSDGTVSYYATALYIQRKAPITPATNDVWLDTSKELLTCYKWSGTAWAEVQFVPFVKVIKTGGVIVSVETLQFNYNGYNINANSGIVFKPKYGTGSQKSYSGFTADSDGTLFTRLYFSTSYEAIIHINNFFWYIAEGAGYFSSHFHLSKGDYCYLQSTANLSTAVLGFYFIPDKNNII